MIRAEKLSKYYRNVPALEGLDIEIPPGEIYCLLGANGAGKSTTIKLFLNIIQPTSGKAYVDGVEVHKDPAGIRKKIAYIPEQVMLYPRLSGLENVQYFTALSNGITYEYKYLIDLLVQSGIRAEDADRPLGTYSKGMRQRTGIAIAMAKRAKVLLLDEPTSGLDPEASFEFSQLLARVAASGVSVLMATHDIFRARDTGHRAGIMRRGRLLREVRTNGISHSELESVYLELMRSEQTPAA
jgi:ABC-2 type transport system ATP-binding protein